MSGGLAVPPILAAIRRIALSLVFRRGRFTPTRLVSTD